MQLWAHPKTVASTPYLMGVIFLAAIILYLLTFGSSQNIMFFGAFVLPLIALVRGFATLMTMWDNPELDPKHPRLKTLTLLFMGIITFYMALALAFMIR